MKNQSRNDLLSELFSDYFHSKTLKRIFVSTLIDLGYVCVLCTCVNARRAGVIFILFDTYIVGEINPVPYV